MNQLEDIVYILAYGKLSFCKSYLRTNRRTNFMHDLKRLQNSDQNNFHHSRMVISLLS